MPRPGRRPDLLAVLVLAVGALALLGFSVRAGSAPVDASDDAGAAPTSAAGAAPTGPDAPAPPGASPSAHPTDPSPRPAATAPSRPSPAAPSGASRPASRPGAPTVTIAFGGDTHGEAPIAAAIASGHDPLAAIAPTLSAADIAVLNLETAVGATGVAADKAYTFQAPPALLDTIRAAGVDVVSLANNHSLDFGVEGLLETIDGARARGLATIGAGRDEEEAYAAHVVEARGVRIAFVGLTRVIPEPGWAATADRAGLASAYTASRAAAAVRAAGTRADHVVAVVHWGQERADCPDEHQVALAGALHEAGAAIVVGAHPHVWQGVHAPAPGRLTAFSLGNFLWYASGEVSGTTGVLTVELGADGVRGSELTPAVIGADGGPVPTAGPEADRLRRRAAELSPGLACPARGTPRP